jgi:hypothetical protein
MSVFVQVIPEGVGPVKELLALLSIFSGVVWGAPG